MNFREIFILIGLLSGVGLSASDWWASYLGLASTMPQDGAFLMRALPFFLSCLVLAMNACASRMVRMFQTSGETQFGILLLFFAFATCLAFDGISSWVGLVQMMTKSESITAAVGMADSVTVASSTIISVLMCIGPFLTTVFADLLIEENGFFARMFGDFLGANPNRKGA